VWVRPPPRAPKRASVTGIKSLCENSQLRLIRTESFLKYLQLMNSETAISTQNLSKKYEGHEALTGLNLEIQSGEIFGFLGHNGAGKTTTVSLLTTILPPTSGSATINGYDVIKKPAEVRNSIGYLPENVQFYQHLTLLENLEYFGQLSGIRKPKNRILETLELLDFSEPINRRLGGFSKGMRQRAGIAQAILHRPRVLFLDEPTSGLDPEGVIQLRELILRLNRELGMTIFMNTHLLDEANKLCGQIGVLKQGRLIYSDTLENAFVEFGTEESLENIYFKIDHKAQV
jgi:ABC-2 type transport system ATP-binding protein